MSRSRKQSPETRRFKLAVWQFLEEWLARNQERRFASDACHQVVEEMKKMFNWRGYYAMYDFGSAWSRVEAIPYGYDHHPDLQEELFGVTDGIRLVVSRMQQVGVSP